MLLGEAAAIAVVGKGIIHGLERLVRDLVVWADWPRLATPRVFLIVTRHIIRLALTITEDFHKLCKFAVNEKLVDFVFSEKLLTCLRELRLIRLFLKSGHHIEPASFIVLLVSEEVCLLLFLLPDARYDEHCEDDDILNQLDVELSAPWQVNKTYKVDEQDDRVAPDYVDLEELFLDGTEVCRLSELGWGKSEAPEC